MKRGAIIAALLAALLRGPAAAGDNYDSQIADAEASLAKTESQIRRYHQEIQRSQRKINSLLQEKDSYDQKARLSEENINLLNLQIRKNEQDLSSLEADLKSRSARASELQSLLGERLTAIYKYGGQAELSLLLSARDSLELRNSAYMLRYVADQDQRMIQSLQEEQLKIQASMENISRQKQQLEQRKRDLQRQRTENQQASQQREKLIQKVNQEKRNYEQAVREFEEDQKALEQKISELMRKKEEEARRRRQEGKGDSKPQLTHKGKFSWPIPQRKLSGNFGTRIHPQFKTKSAHTGIDVPAPKGTPVGAGAAGDVLYAGWLRGYGQVVILDHGSGFSTVYAHMSAILVEEGQRVNEGEPVGKVGATGVATGNHLHFEVRVNGKAQDPLKYLDR